MTIVGKISFKICNRQGFSSSSAWFNNVKLQNNFCAFTIFSRRKRHAFMIFEDEWTARKPRSKIRIVKFEEKFIPFMNHGSGSVKRQNLSFFQKLFNRRLERV